MINLIDSISNIAQDAFEDRCYEEAEIYESLALSLLPSKDSSFALRAMKLYSNKLFYGCEQHSLDSIRLCANMLLSSMKDNQYENTLEYFVHLSRKKFYDALEIDCVAKDSISDVALNGIKQIIGEKSKEYADALTFKAVMLLRSIPDGYRAEKGRREMAVVARGY